MTKPRPGTSVDDDDGPAGEVPAIRVHLDELLSQRGMTLTELSARVDLTIANLSILKNGHARAIRFTTMARLCEVLQCQPGDLLSYRPMSPVTRGQSLPGKIADSYPPGSGG